MFNVMGRADLFGGMGGTYLNAVIGWMRRDSSHASPDNLRNYLHVKLCIFTRRTTCTTCSYYPKTTTARNHVITVSSSIKLCKKHSNPAVHVALRGFDSELLDYRIQRANEKTISLIITSAGLVCQCFVFKVHTLHKRLKNTMALRNNELGVSNERFP